MLKKYLKSLLIFIVTFFFFNISIVAQTKLIIEKPSVILFMLKSSTNKIKSLENKGLKKDAIIVKETDIEINNSIMKDFNKNFTFCPVYFFNESQLNFVLHMQWDSIIFYDFEYLKTGKKIEVSQISNFIIAEVAYPPAPEYPEIDINNKIIEPGYNTDIAIARDYGILCYDEHYKLLRNNLQFTNISFYRNGNMFKPKTLRYNFLGARIFQKKIENFFTKKP